ncbi:MAG: nicotinate-nucleotide adenylyltransferase [Chloroflexi bacterium]|nr:nicotinate-nucleotide adenylyltransferase [Chloroflexota bacterium]
MRIGIMGGTFDPIHMAHLVLAEDARERLGLSYVLFIPTGDPWLKREKPLASPAERLRMVELAVESNAFFHALDVEVRREGPTYTADTLEYLRGDLTPQDELFFMLGMDSLAELPRWYRPNRVVELCSPVAFRRPGVSEHVLEAAMKAAPLLRRKLILMDTPLLDVSSTDIRQRVAEGRSIRYLVPDAVEEFIRENRLYQTYS